MVESKNNEEREKKKTIGSWRDGVRLQLRESGWTQGLSFSFYFSFFFFFFFFYIQQKYEKTKEREILLS